MSDAGTVTRQDLERAFAKLTDDSRRQAAAERSARFAAAWAERFPKGTGHYSPEEQAFLARMWAAGSSGEAVHPQENQQLTELIYREMDPAVILARATKPLLEMWSVIDTVFSEGDALAPDRQQVSLGRIYRAWRAARNELDPDGAP